MSTINTARVYYLDGRVEEVAISMWEQKMAANYMRDHNLGTIVDDPITFQGYQAYVKLRQDGRVTQPFDQWMRTVVHVEDIKLRGETGDDTGNPSTGGPQEV